MNFMYMKIKTCEHDKAYSCWKFRQGVNRWHRHWLYLGEDRQIQMFQEALSALLSNRDTEIHHILMGLADDAGNSWILERKNNSTSYRFNGQNLKEGRIAPEVVSKIWSTGADLEPIDRAQPMIRQYEITKERDHLQAREKRDPSNPTQSSVEFSLTRLTDQYKEQIAADIGFKSEASHSLSDDVLRSISQKLRDLEICTDEIDKTSVIKFDPRSKNTEIDRLLKEHISLSEVEYLYAIASKICLSQSELDQISTLEHNILSLEENLKENLLENIFSNSGWIQSLASDCQIEAIREWRKTIGMVSEKEIPKVTSVISAYSRPFETILKEDSATIKSLVQLIKKSRELKSNKLTSLEKCAAWVLSKFQSEEKNVFARKDAAFDEQAREQKELFLTLNKVLGELSALRRSFVEKKRQLVQTSTVTEDFFSKKYSHLKKIEDKWAQSTNHKRLTSHEELKSRLNSIHGNMLLQSTKKELEVANTRKQVHDFITTKLSSAIASWRKKYWTKDTSVNLVADPIQSSIQLQKYKKKIGEQIIEISEYLDSTVNNPEKDLRYLSQRRDHLVREIQKLLTEHLPNHNWDAFPLHLTSLRENIDNLLSLKNIIRKGDFNILKPFNPQENPPIATWSIRALGSKKDQIDLIQHLEETNSKNLNIILTSDPALFDAMGQLSTGFIADTDERAIPSSNPTEERKMPRPLTPSHQKPEGPPSKASKPTLTLEPNRGAPPHHVITEKKKKISPKKAQEVVDLLNGIIFPKHPESHTE